MAPESAAPQEGLPEDLGTESEAEEPEEVRRIAACRKPTRKQTEEHEDENHAVYREWCEVCVASRGTGTPHRRRRGVVHDEQEGPRIMSDYFCINDDEQSMPMLAIKFSRSKRIAAIALPFKGLTEYGVKAFARFIQSTGVRNFVNHSDGEPALKALKDAAARSILDVEHVPKEVPVGDHAQNGEIEVAVRELKRQMRAIRLALESRLGRRLEPKDPC